MFIVSALRPGVLVELGVYRGTSYCAFCQTVKKLGFGTTCHGVDSWEGDGQAGQVSAVDLARLKAHHDPLYGSFSELVQSTFDGALDHFADGSIDLLHIDGYHSYEAVSHDFESWLPKMSERGVVLFHDVNVRQSGFGVWKYWEEVSAKYKHLTLLHGHGLGVLGVGSNFPEDVRELFDADKNDLLTIRNFFHQLGARIDAIWQYHSQSEQFAELKTYEATVKKSWVMRAYRMLRFKGLAGFTRKIRPAPMKSGEKRDESSFNGLPPLTNDRHNVDRGVETR